MKNIFWIDRLAVFIALVLISEGAQAWGKKAPRPEPQASPSFVAEPSPKPSASTVPPTGQKILVTLGPDMGSNVDRKFAQSALDLINEAHSNGCLEQKISSHKFRSLQSVVNPQAKTSPQAYVNFVAKAPYALDLRWYYKSSKVIGYTYNYLTDTYGEAPEGASETHIWSNTKYINKKNPASYAAHLVHELSHQARAWGYVHYSFFTGSFPYDAGDLAAECFERRAHETVGVPYRKPLLQLSMSR